MSCRTRYQYECLKITRYYRYPPNPTGTKQPVWPSTHSSDSPLRLPYPSAPTSPVTPTATPNANPRSQIPRQNINRLLSTNALRTNHQITHKTPRSHTRPVYHTQSTGSQYLGTIANNDDLSSSWVGWLVCRLVS